MQKYTEFVTCANPINAKTPSLQKTTHTLPPHSFLMAIP